MIVSTLVKKIEFEDCDRYQAIVKLDTGEFFEVGSLYDTWMFCQQEVSMLQYRVNNGMPIAEAVGEMLLENVDFGIED